MASKYLLPPINIVFQSYCTIIVSHSYQQKTQVKVNTVNEHSHVQLISANAWSNPCNWSRGICGHLGCTKCVTDTSHPIQIRHLCTALFVQTIVIFRLQLRAKIVQIYCIIHVVLARHAEGQAKLANSSSTIR